MTKRSKRPKALARAEHRAEHRTGPTTALVDWLGDPIGQAVEKRATGRPPVTLSDDAIDAAADALRSGVAETKVARALGVNFRTWQRLREEDDRLADAGAEAKKLEEEELVGVLMEKARKGEVVPLLFALKARHSYRDQGPAGPGWVSNSNVTINLPPSMSSDEYRRMIDITPVGHAPAFDAVALPPEQKSKKGDAS